MRQVVIHDAQVVLVPKTSWMIRSVSSTPRCLTIMVTNRLWLVNWRQSMVCAQTGKVVRLMCGSVIQRVKPCGASCQSWYSGTAWITSSHWRTSRCAHSPSASAVHAQN